MSKGGDRLMSFQRGVREAARAVPAPGSRRGVSIFTRRPKANRVPFPDPNLEAEPDNGTESPCHPVTLSPRHPVTANAPVLTPEP